MCGGSQTVHLNLFNELRKGLQQLKGLILWVGKLVFTQQQTFVIRGWVLGTRVKPPPPPAKKKREKEIGKAEWQIRFKRYLAHVVVPLN